MKFTLCVYDLTFISGDGGDGGGVTDDKLVTKVQPQRFSFCVTLCLGLKKKDVSLTKSEVFFVLLMRPPDITSLFVATKTAYQIYEFLANCFFLCLNLTRAEAQPCHNIGLKIESEETLH